ncbi:hypothetical protein, partial [Providencia stuartii]|uniref:hypothetical protein n=1 Tax=Providencia stuartii TaxID=588 RepID=UPI00331B2A47
ISTNNMYICTIKNGLSNLHIKLTKLIENKFTISFIFISNQIVTLKQKLHIIFGDILFVPKD